MPTIRVQEEDFDAAAEARALSEGRSDIGALVTFVGLCRDEGGRLAALEIEHYPGIANEIARAVAEAEARWPLLGVTVVHRYGAIRAGEQIVGRHRLRASRRGFRGGGNADGLSKNPRPVLEKGVARGRDDRELG